MAEINWPRFAKEVVWTPKVHAALEMLHIEIPPNGRPHRFKCGRATVQVIVGSGGVFLCWNKKKSTSFIVGNGNQVIAHLQPMPAYGAAGKALRAWLTLWGWEPPKKVEPAADSPPLMVL